MSPAAGSVRADVVIVGAGPAGSVLAWDLARRGVRPLLLDRTSFPREKVCGDFVEPRGLRIMQAMGCLAPLERNNPRPVSRVDTFVEGRLCYSGPIAFYGDHEQLSSHGYVIAREELDVALLEAAVGAGAIVRESTSVTGVNASAEGVEVTARQGSRTRRYRAPLLVGADGVNSYVARSQGLAAADPRRTVVAQRAYADVDLSDSVGFFDESLFPGYGWIFPMRDGRVNVGVGLLSETRQRLGVRLPVLFRTFLDGLRRQHSQFAELELTSPPIGGAVKTYGGAGRNVFDGGLLVGDAGSFVDPMTGEGITPAMESALLASRTLTRALAAGRFDARTLASYEKDFHAYFDPAWSFLDFCAAMLRNRHLARPWLKAFARGCELAQAEPEFARIAGSFFGGPEIRPFAILAQVWGRVARDILLPGGPRLPRAARTGLLAGRTSLGDLLEWQIALSQSALSDPAWHTGWWIDMQRRWSGVLARGWDSRSDPRTAGLLDADLGGLAT